MGLVNCPECNYSPVSDQATACPKCGYPIKKAEYKFCSVNGFTGFGGPQLRQHLSEGWQVVRAFPRAWTSLEETSVEHRGGPARKGRALR